jgi:hypothetical protein
MHEPLFYNLIPFLYDTSIKERKFLEIERTGFAEAYHRARSTRRKRMKNPAAISTFGNFHTSRIDAS